ncbi:MAG: ATP-binding protein [Lachnospiraceae bacterium]|nr:ATP-binding protein [Lachnospiraceae bacterium]
MKELNRKNKKERRWLALFAVILAVTAVLAAVVLAMLFRSYRKTVLDSQSDQLMNISESVANNLEVYLESFQDLAEGLVVLDQFTEARGELLAGDANPMQNFLTEIEGERTEEIVYLCYTAASGESCAVGEDRSYTLSKSMGAGEAFQETEIMVDGDGAYYFSLSASDEADGCLVLYVPLETVYEKTASYIQMGENGYVMIKDSDGLILMHPVEEQIGMDVLADRKALYPDLDYSELETLIGNQLAGKSGVEIYYSYWWADDPPSRTQKVSAYLPVTIGGDFLIVSAVMDYSEIIGPVQSVGLRILLFSVLLVLVLLAGILFMWNTVTRRIKIERENAYLKEVNERLEQLRRQEEILSHQQRLQLIGTMTGGIAHEFNNLLTPIMGYSAMILAGMSEDDENYEDMQEILGSAEKAKEIIDQITQFSRKNAEKMFQPMHIGEAVKKALIITEAAKPRNITMVSEINTERDVCMGNPVQIHQMIVNLCNNAIHAMGSEPGTLKIRGEAMQPTRKQDPFFRGKEKKWFYRITVEDTGCGMSQETIDQIFIPFFTTKKPGEGTGLGLAIVQRLVEAHEGLICVHSEEGKGTCFVIYLPILEESQGIEVENYH